MEIIRTKQKRMLKSLVGKVEIEALFSDKPATLSTWTENCQIIARETGKTEDDIFESLLQVVPELYLSHG